ncbi:polyribonucleotide nucleotidyltransferase [Candidatus Peregrinibacteria bacterium RIFCSPLOWO2_01_FULL_39_12]|nr:MAG: polyribonucleotide nucleotidyltransferase [Candidatus Peregrinibacteria bacterium RIFCSPLOWO2_01_FULL_39_12]
MKMDLAGRELRISVSPISTYANGSAVVSLGDTVIMANATMSEKGKEGADFFPMTVDYEENFYAAGKIKGSRFIKREGRPSENAILTSRLIDRPIRPLFPKGTINEVQLICSVLSADQEVDPGVTAMNAASVALLLSGAPFAGPIGAVRMGYLNEKLVVNPTYKECEEGKMSLIVAGTIDAITMVEAEMKEVTEEIILEAMEMAHKYIKEICEFQIKFAKQFNVKKIEADILKPSDEAVKAVNAVISEDALAVTGKTKKEVKEKIHEMEAKILEKYAKEIEDEVFSEGELKEVLNNMLEKKMRKNILEKEERLDGRKLDEIRPITIIPDPLPRTHGSAIFQRGETMALTITTLGGPGDAQIIDTMVEDITKRYFHHYHFPPFATGDIKMLRGPGRREIGHGDLAERALVPMLPTKEEFPYTMWLVSEIIRCNGSSSMASVCGSTLSLMCAGVPIKKPVAGIAMGLVTDTESKSYKILTDIQGMEDFAGDMDFKVAGTVDGITALQMDIKIKGLSIKVMKEAMEKAKQARLAILEKMIEVVPEPRKHLSKYAPLIMSLQIDPEMIRIVIGKGGETIQGITKECEVEMDISDEGLVTITAPDQEKGNKALEWVKRITYVPEVGETFEGKVTRILEFGAFVEFLPGKEGLVHISELSKERVGRVEDVVKIGDTIKVKLMKIDEQGRYNLSHKAVMSASPKPPTAGHNAASPGDKGSGTLRKV